MKRILHLTIEKLRMFDACQKAQDWFLEEYPIGVYLTKNDLLILVDKLLARKHSFFMTQSLDKSVGLCTNLCMIWLLESIYGVEPFYTNNLGMDESTTRNKILKVFYKDLKTNKPVIKKKVTR